MKLRTLIVDDEAPARERLRRLLSSNSLVELTGEAGKGYRKSQPGAIKEDWFLS